MSPHSLLRGFVTAALLPLAAGGAPLSAQSVHIPPPSMPPLAFEKHSGPYADSVKPLITIVPAPAGAGHGVAAGGEIRLFKGWLRFVTPAGRADSLRVTGTSIQAIANDLNANFDSVRAIAHFAEIDGRYLLQQGPDPIVAGDTLRLRGSLGPPTVALTFGGLYGLSPVTDGADDPSLFSDGGFQLDAVAQVPLHRRWFYRVRATFSSADRQALKTNDEAVGADSSGVGESERGTSVESVIQSSERFAMAGSLDWLVRDESRLEVGLNVEAEVAWTIFDPFQMPDTIVVDDVPVALTSAYSEDQIAAVRRSVNRHRAAGSLWLGGWVQFPSGDLRVHALASMGFSRRIEQRVSYPETTAAEPDGLRDATKLKMEPFYRLGVGMSLGSTADMRADALIPVEPSSNYATILRLYLSKSIDLQLR